MSPTLRATMERRVLVNYRVDPVVLAGLLPGPFRPALVQGHGIAGICLIRLGQIRPPGVPAALGLTTENAAHRVAVEWDTPDGVATGVYIPRRDTSSWLTALAGGRVFPGWHHLARFRVQESDDGFYRVQAESSDREVRINVSARASAEVMAGSAFADLESASRFFRCAPVGYSATRRAGVFDGVELGTGGWRMRPLQVEEAESSFFDDPARFPAGSAILDSAFLMAGLSTIWHPKPELVPAHQANAPA